MIKGSYSMKGYERSVSGQVGARCLKFMVSDMISSGSVSCVYFMISFMFYPDVPKNLTSLIEKELGFVTKFTFLR